VSAPAAACERNKAAGAVIGASVFTCGEEKMAIDGNDGHGGPRAEQPAKSAKIVWLIGLALLALVVVIAIRSFVAGADVPTAEDAAKAPITETDQAIAGTKVENSSGH
jgi:hypothetical protein